ncbi:MAG TPA: hypothetical protein PLB89_05280 [Flavobacteriales bacterium]|nr:hypothetical protein [Flavobacteriales bacterium]
MTRLVDITLLSAPLRALVIGELRAELEISGRDMTYQEASMLFDVPYDNIRTYIHQGRIRTVGARKGNKRIEQAEMHKFCSTYRPKLLSRRNRHHISLQNEHHASV